MTTKKECCRYEHGDCLFYGVPCQGVKQQWDECKRQKGEKLKCR